MKTNYLKLLLVAAMLCLGATFMRAAQTSVTLSQAGELSTKLGDKVLTVTDLKISGPINSADVKVLHKMLGVDDNGMVITDKSEKGALSTLDLSDANIVASSEAYYMDVITTENNVVGKYMFYGCSNLTSIALPVSATSIEGQAFMSCSNLQSVTMGDAVTSIGNDAFDLCSKLTTVNLSDALETIGRGAFSECTSLTSVTIGNNVTTIDEKAFENCSSMTTLTIGAAVSTIGQNAFSGCDALTSITCVSETPAAMDGDEFGDVNLGYITLYVPTGATESYSSVECWKLCTIQEIETGYMTVTLTEAGTIADKISDSRKLNITDLKVVGPINGTDIKFIREMAGNDLTGASTDGKLVKLDLSEANIVAGGDAYYQPYSTPYETTDNQVGDYMFYSTKLTKVILPSTATAIGASAFENCSSLATLTMGDAVETIGESAFYKCTGLTLFTFGSGVTTINRAAFDQCSSLKTVNFSDNIIAIANRAFRGCSSLKSVTLPAKLRSLGDNAFNECSNLEKVVMGDLVATIGDRVFEEDSKLSSINFSETLATIGESAFRGTAITEITFPNSLTAVGDAAFEECGSLATVNFGTGLQSVSGLMFADCTALESIVIPVSATSIGQEAFSNCTKLKSITIPASVTKIEDGAFGGTAISEIVIPETTTELGAGLFYYCPNLASVNIPEGVTELGEGFFDGCTSLPTITLPSSLTTLGSSVFANCNSLKSIVCRAKTVPTAESSTFNSAPTTTCKLYVRGKLIDSYAADSYWGAFKNIEEYDKVTVTVTTPGSISDDINNIEGAEKMDIYSLKVIGDINGTDIKYIREMAGRDVDGGETTGCLAKLDLSEANIVEGGDAYYSAYTTSDNVVDSNMFYKTNLTTVALPNTAERIGVTAFRECASLKTVTMGNAVTTIQNAAFANCAALESITLSEGLQTIGNMSFSGCSALTSVAIPEKVTKIGNNAFDGCSAVKELTIGAAVATIGTEAFSGCTAIESIDCAAETVPTLGTDVFKSMTQSSVILYVPYTAIDDYKAADQWKEFNIIQLGQLTITVNPAGTIADEISDAQKLAVKSLKVLGYINGTDVKFIREMAGRNADDTETTGRLVELDLSEVSIVEGGEMYYGTSSSYYQHSTANNKVGSRMFKGCKLTKVVLPESADEIQDYVFEGCSALASVTIGNNTTKIGEDAFKECTALETIDIPASVTSMESGYAFQDCTSLTTVNFIGNGIENIGNKTFAGCTALTSMNIPESVTTLGTSLFSDCTSLKSVTIPDGITSLPNRMFDGCSSLTSVAMPENLKTIGKQAFYECSALTNVSFSDNLTSIGRSAFYGCTSLANVNIGSGVTSIDDQAFAYCSSLKDFITGCTVPPVLGDDVFDSASTSTATLHVPTGTGDDYRADTQWASFGTIDDNITSGINQVETTEAVEVARFDINGRRLAEPTNGVNIIRMSDGSVRKEIVVK